MKERIITILLIFGYLLAFSLAGFLFYDRYLKFKIVNTEIGSKENSQSKIYYTTGNNLYSLNAEIINQQVKQNQTNLAQSTGKIDQLTINPKTVNLFYDSLNLDNKWEIWKVNQKDNGSQKVFSSQIAGFENFTSFTNPKISPDGQQVGFIASKKTENYLFITKADDTGNFKNISANITNQAIVDFGWSPKDNKIALITFGDAFSVAIINLDDTTLKNIYTTKDELAELSWNESSLYFLSKNANNETNLNKIDIPEGSSQAIPTNISGLKSIQKYFFDNLGEHIAYEVKSQDPIGTDVYLSNYAGENLIQLTKTGEAVGAVFSTNEDYLAFFDKDGIYRLDIKQNKKEKILNLKTPIDKILAWSK